MREAVSEKVVRWLMSGEGFVVCSINRRKYSSYIGEISPKAANIINCSSRAEQPDEKWLTDITALQYSGWKSVYF